MTNDAILIPGEDDEVCDLVPESSILEYLKISECLRELTNLDGIDGRAIARSNLDVYSTGEIDQSEEKIEAQLTSIRENADTANRILFENINNIEQAQNLFVKKDGSTPFEEILTGRTPSGDSNINALATVEYILRKLASYPTTSEVSETIQTKLAILELYALLSDVYKKSNTYCKAQINNLLKEYVRADGTTPFSQPQEGKYPKLRTLLATKGYADDVIKQHKNELDPHNFLASINLKLANYYKKSEIYTKSLTYSRLLLDLIIDTLVSNACKNLIEEHINTTLHLSSQEVQQILKLYASINLVTKFDLDEYKDEVTNQITESSPIWKTSGPVLTTVGFVEDNTELPKEMSMLEILDSIFYGSKISINVPNGVSIGEKVDVTVCIHGGMQIDSIILYQDEEILELFEMSDFKDGCITVPSTAIVKDTEFKFKVIYSNGIELEETARVNLLYPVFVGLLPKWKFGHTISMSYLEELHREDSTGTQNQFFNYGRDLSTIVFKYQFLDSKLRHPLLVLPAKYPDLDNMITKSQSFGKEAFEVIDMIPLQIPGIEKDIIYKIYIYKQALSKLDLEVTFNFILS